MSIKDSSIRKAILSLLLILLLKITISCDTTEPISGKTLTLELKDVSCTEAWLQFTSTGLELPNTLTLYVDDKINETIELATEDTLIYIDSLLPNKSYKVKATLNTTDNQQLITNEVTVNTMDTTRSDFTWQTFTFGGSAGSCALYDITIINENDIWAVGEIDIADSSVNGYTTYNAVHWDGTDWKLMRIFFPTVCSSSNSLSSFPASAVFALDDGKVFITSSGDKIAILQNNIEIDNFCLPTAYSMSIFRIWGSTNNNMYIVGSSGKIIKYSDDKWEMLETGTTTIIPDVWGIEDQNNNTILYCPVSSFFYPGDKKILKITNEIVDSVTWNKNKRLYSAWTNNENFLYVCGEGVYENMFGVWKEINLITVGTNSVRGNNINDVIVVGDYGFIAHNNGAHWKVLGYDYTKGYAHVDIKENIVAICGQSQGLALIEIGKRN